MDYNAVIFCMMSFIFTFGNSLPPSCSSNIYCFGDLLHTVQMAHLFNDSKTFVDMKLKKSPNETLQRFYDFMEEHQGKPRRDQVRKFVYESFDDAGSELENWDPPDWNDNPSFLKNIKDKELKQWAKKLNDFWKMLGKRIKDEVKYNKEFYSIIYVPNPVIVPGGRFREFYYWDSYWIVRGLLLSEMYETVRGMLENFLLIVQQYGFIPNGGRVYYAMRSQPPLLIPMVESYMEKTNDLEFLKSNIDTMEKEFQYWLTNHTVVVHKNGKTYTLARYTDISEGPRPESYREDYDTAKVFRTDSEKQNFYNELKAGAESGWDFSSRWFILNGTNKGNLTNLKVKSIIPVDLNAIIYWDAKILSKFYNQLGFSDKGSHYLNISETWLDAVTEILWHEEIGVWLDYDILNGVRRDYFYPTNISPLWTGCYNFHKNFAAQIGKIMKYLERSEVMINLGGIPTTLEHSGEQWDFPNAWPPLQHIMIIGLDATDDDGAKELAFQMTEKWVRSNYKAFNETHAMFEKYDATVSGSRGGGGEYDVQLGFGWTNGVIMDLLDKYGERLTVEDEFVKDINLVLAAQSISGSVSTLGQVLTLVLALVIPVVIGCIGMYMYRSKKHTEESHSQPSKLYSKLHGGYMELKDLPFNS